MSWLDRFETITAIPVMIGTIIFPFAAFAILWFSAAGSMSDAFIAWGCLFIAGALILLPLILQLLVYLGVMIFELSDDSEKNEKKIIRCGHARREEWQQVMKSTRGITNV